MIVQQMTITLHVPGTVTVADNKARWEAPYAGEVIAVGGDITTLGSGAGTSTDFQIHNATAPARDLLSTVGAFEVDSATNVLEGQEVNPANATFAAGDILRLDCDAIATAPADARIYLLINLFMDDV